MTTMHENKKNTTLSSCPTPERKVQIINVNFLEKEVTLVTKRFVAMATEAIIGVDSVKFQKEQRILMDYDEMLKTVHTFCHGFAPGQKKYVMENAIANMNKQLQLRGWHFSLEKIPYWCECWQAEIRPYR